MWVPPEHWLLKVRLAIWAFSAIGATKEYYEYMANKYCYKFGPFVWLACMTLLVEFSIITKFGIHLFTQPFPQYVIVIWVVIGLLMLAGGVYSYLNKLKSESNKSKSEEKASFNPFDPPIDIDPFNPAN